MKTKNIDSVKNLLKKLNIDFNIINSPGQTAMAQISSYKVSYDLKKECKKLGYEIINIDSTSLIS